MNKRYLNWWLLATLFVLSSPVIAQKYSIHLAAFPEQIEPSFFNFAGFNEVHHQQNTFNFHQYSWGNFSNLESAKQQLATLQKNPLLKGLSNLSILPQTNHFKVPTTDSSIDPTIEIIDFQLFTRSIFIHTASKSIQTVDVAVLEEVANILKQNPALKLRILATANSKNPILTTPFTTVVENFLLAQNIPAYRIKIIPNPLPANLEMTEMPISKKQQVLMTLVDLKEEIVLDKFKKVPFAVKQISKDNTLDILD